MFARLYEFDGRQVLVRKANDSDGAPSICFEVEWELGQAEMHLSFSDDEAGEASRNGAFDKVTEEQAMAAAKQVWNLTDSADARALIAAQPQQEVGQ